VEAALTAGIVCAIGWSIGLRGLLDGPSVDASDAEIVRFNADLDTGPRTLLLLQVIVIATIGFLWFVGVVRSWLGEHEPKLFGTVFVGGSVLMAGVLFAGSAALAAPAVLGQHRWEDAGPACGVDDSGTGSDVALGVRAAHRHSGDVATAALGRKIGALPRWLVLVTDVVGVAEFANFTISRPTAYVFPAWIAVVSIVMIIRLRPTRVEVHTERSQP